MNKVLVQILLAKQNLIILFFFCVPFLPNCHKTALYQMTEKKVQFIYCCQCPVTIFLHISQFQILLFLCCSKVQRFSYWIILHASNHKFLLVHQVMNGFEFSSWHSNWFQHKERRPKKALETSCCLARREHLRKKCIIFILHQESGEERETDARGKVSLIIIYGQLEKPFQDQEEKGLSSEMHFQLPVSSLCDVLRMQPNSKLAAK